MTYTDFNGSIMSWINNIGVSSTLHHHGLTWGGFVTFTREVGYTDRILGVWLCVCIVKVELA